MYRVNGIVNLDAWYEAFGVTDAHALYLPPDERIVIWYVGPRRMLGPPLVDEATLSRERIATLLHSTLTGDCL